MATVLAIVATALVVAPRPARAATLIVTNCNNSGAGSLRQAVADAASGDTIVFALAPACSVITLSSEIGSSKNLTITGPGAALLAVSGNDASRVFALGGTVAISGLTIRNGRVSCSSFSCIGGGGGILNSGTLTLTSTTLSANTTSCFGFLCSVSGGGIFNAGTGTLTLTNTTLSANTALCFGDRCFAQGGGITNEGFTVGSSVTVTNSTLSANTTSCGGSGCTARGGGIFTVGSAVTVTASTLSANSASCGGSGCVAQGGGIRNQFAPVTATQTIVANSPSGGNCSGTITDGGFNLTWPVAAAGTCPGIQFDPLLGPLADNGGPTKTHALLAGSAAIDAGGACNPPITTDQRGVPRPQGAACDIGAYEASTLAIPTITTTPNPTTATAGPATFLNDTATLSGGSNPTGTVTFNLYPPADANCTGTPSFTATVNLSGLSATTNNTTVAATTPGTWHWTATYSGDANNFPVSSACAVEPVVVGKAIPTITTTPNPTTATAGPATFLNDTATLSGGSNPTGTVTFKLYDPTDPTCLGTPVYTELVALSLSATNNTTVAATTAGTWHWTATYSGDANNASVSSACADEPVVVSSAPTGGGGPGADGPGPDDDDDDGDGLRRAWLRQGVVAGAGGFRDRALITNNRARGTVTFFLCTPSQVTRAGCPAGRGTRLGRPRRIVGDHPVTSPRAAPTLPGTYCFRVHYSGDANFAEYDYTNRGSACFTR